MAGAEELARMSAIEDGVVTTIRSSGRGPAAVLCLSTGERGVGVVVASKSEVGRAPEAKTRFWRCQRKYCFRL